VSHVEISAGEPARSAGNTAPQSVRKSIARSSILMTFRPLGRLFQENLPKKTCTPRSVLLGCVQSDCSRRVRLPAPVFGASDAMTSDVPPLFSQRRRSDDMLVFLEYLLGDYAHFDVVTFFMDNCLIHHAQTARVCQDACCDNVGVIWNAA
jgi:hypothetical protein